VASLLSSEGWPRFSFNFSIWSINPSSAFKAFLIDSILSDNSLISSVFGSYHAIANFSSLAITRSSSPSLNPSVKMYSEALIILPSSSLSAGTKA
jgi:hypothetical protein